ncbi:MAG: HTTM domain-containing protein [Planctomycetes bacterium]|nr:HTTM domain-containing protein [Planctomycetota bacterium]
MSTAVTAESRQSSGSIWNQFFFAREVPYGMALVRLLLPAVLLVDIVRRWAHARELYSTDGALATLHLNFGYPDMLPELSAPWAVGLFTVLGVLMFTSAIGWCTRFSLLGSCALYFYFSYMDCLSTATKYTVISQHILLLLGMSNCGDIWSVDAWLAKRRGQIVDPRGAIWPQRLCQILFGMIYFGAGITKMHTDGFFSGDQLVFWMMTYVNNEHPLGDHMTRYPLWVSIGCYATFVWEIVFIFTIFQRRLKWPTLAIGTVFHLMTVFTLGLILFPILVSAAYLVFLSEAEFKTILSWSPFRWLSGVLAKTPADAPAESVAEPVVEMPRMALRWRFGSPAVFASVLGVAALVGVAVEYQLDHYQMRGPNGPLPLPELALEEVQKMLAGDEPIRAVDKLMAFDLGSTLVAEHLASHRTVYEQGETFFAQVSLNPPHEDMWIDCVMCEAVPDANDESRLVPGRVLYRTGQVIMREAFRTNFRFTVDSGIAPGEYFLKVKSGNDEMARRHFTVLSKDSDEMRAASAN